MDVGNVENADAHLSKKSRGIDNQPETDTKHPCIYKKVNASRKPINLSKVICSYSIPHVWLEKVTPNTLRVENSGIFNTGDTMEVYVNVEKKWSRGKVIFIEDTASHETKVSILYDGGFQETISVIEHCRWRIVRKRPSTSLTFKYDPVEDKLSELLRSVRLQNKTQIVTTAFYVVKQTFSSLI